MTQRHVTRAGLVLAAIVLTFAIPVLRATPIEGSRSDLLIIGTEAT